MRFHPVLLVGFFSVLAACSDGSTDPDPTPEPFAIEGTVFYDVDADGARGSGETGLEGFVVFLDQNRNDVLDAGEAQTSTDANGAFRFDGLAADQAHTVSQVLPRAWTNTAPGGPALSAPAAQVGSGAPARIIGGANASPGDFPGEVAVLLSGVTPQFEALWCGGSLIAGRWVLTAANCIVEGGVTQQLDVLLATVELDAGGVRVPAANVVVHPDYDEASFTYNAALIELPTVQIEPRAVAFESISAALLEPGATLTATGWGAVTSDGEFFPSVLQRADVEVVDNTMCDQIYSSITADMLCAGGEAGIGTCTYDEGGGLYAGAPQRPQLAGIASWFGVDTANLCAGQGLPSGWTRLSAILPFLEQHVTAESSGAVTVAGQAGATTTVEFGNFR